RTKMFLERQDKTTNYLIYAPFPKPLAELNHLEDMLLYSRRFYADRASLICVDLGIPEKYKPIIQKHIKFFGEKKRTRRFYDLEISNFTDETIEIALMSAVCQSKVVSFEEVVRILLTDGNLENNKFLTEFERYDLLEAFWKQCENSFGYTDHEPSVEKLVITLFVTYTAKYVKEELPKSWKDFISYKPGNIMVFLDSLKNNVVYCDYYDRLSGYVETKLSVGKAFAGLAADCYVECDTYPCVDQLLVSWIKERLAGEDTGARLDGMSIPEICRSRQKKHFGSKMRTSYTLLEAAWHIICAAAYQPEKELKDIQKRYISEDYKIDAWYRTFIRNLDQQDGAEDFGKLYELCENIYTNEYLGKLLPAWNAAFDFRTVQEGIPQQRNFYEARIKNVRERIIVIISDGMRFEVGKTLAERLEQDPNSTVSVSAQLSVLPSYTALGMAALLPHKTLEMADDYEVLIDDKPTDGIPAREAVVQKYQPLGVCIQFDDLKYMKNMKDTAGLRSVLTGRQVVYVYHNQIDARGEGMRTEDEVFNACDECIEEIFAMIRWIATNGNSYRFIVTADHGFLYKRAPLDESDKIGNRADKGAFLDRRFMIDQEAVLEDGVAHTALGDVLGNDDTRQISFPISTNVFKTGGGMNYVHGGSSPQEMIVPVLDIKMERYHMEVRTVQIALISIVRKITNLITSLDFIQTEAVSDIVKETNFQIYFIDQDNERITNENRIVADSKSDDPAKRITRLRFTFKNKKYDSVKHYYLVAFDEKNNMEAFRQEVTIDIAFADDFGF
ncbi:MAG: BREX-1 system phosphatase PglZ type A, partial [Blautia sp.]|nr:BREX-1 system phosphatase PglZ type A [Blautia sp.]